MSQVVAFALRPRPELDACSFAGFSHIMPGFFVALGPAGRYLYGRLGVDRIPDWASRIHLNDAAFARLTGTLKPDEPQSGDAQASPADVPDAPADVPAGAFLTT